MTGERKRHIADVTREKGLSHTTLTLLDKETAQNMRPEAIEKLGLLCEYLAGTQARVSKARMGIFLSENGRLKSRKANHTLKTNQT